MTDETKIEGGAKETAAQRESRKAQAQGVDTSAAAKDEPRTPFVVDGHFVSEEEYFKAAEKSPWDVQFLRERKYYPEISTK